MPELFLQPHPEFPSVREIVFNRADKRNALNLAMWQQLREFILMCHTDEEVRVIVFRSTDSRVFCSGADISEFPSLRNDELLAKTHKAITDATTVALATARPVTIAAISGICYGGGVQLATACDIRLAEQTATFAVTPIKLGFVYGPFETELLLRAAGESLATEMLLTGRPISAHTAYQRGLVSELCPGNISYEEFLSDYLATVLSVAPKAQQSMKRVIHQLSIPTAPAEHTLSQPAVSRYHQLNNGFSGIAEADEYKEGIESFLEKRIPFYQELRGTVVEK